MTNHHFKEILTFISCHFSSVKRNELHDFTKSNNVFGAVGTSIYEAFELESSLAEGLIEGDDVDELIFGGSAEVGLPLSRGVNTVLLPEARNMPPPTRLGLALSLACLASLNEFGLDAPLVEFVGNGEVGVGGVLPSSEPFLSLSMISLPVVKGTVLLPKDASVAGNSKE